MTEYQFKQGDHVKWLCPYGYYAYGHITIIKDDTAKVLFNGGFDWNYDYYPMSKLELTGPDDEPNTILQKN